MADERKEPEGSQDLEQRLARLERLIQGGADAGLSDRLARLGEARRASYDLAETPGSQLIRRQVKAIAQKHGGIVEWTLRPLPSSEAAICGCVCGCGCSCIA